MRRVVTAVVGTVLGLVLLLGFKSHSSATGTPYAAISSSNGTTSSGTPSTGSAGAGRSSSSSAKSAKPGKSATSSTASKTADGATVDTRYGPVQVRVTVKSGKITAVNPVQLPQDNPRDIEIDNYAVPQLTQEVLAAQSARVDMVSGATYTSEGYLQSLQSALDKLGV